MRFVKVAVVLGALALVFLILTPLFLLKSYNDTVRDLREVRKEGLARVEAHLEKGPGRPVLRGEALEGNGGPILMEVIEDIRAVAENGEVKNLALLRLLNDGTLETDQVEEVRKAYRTIRPLLPRAREAIQHEWCRLGDTYEGLQEQSDSLMRPHMPLYGLGGALALDARERASEGDLSGALECLADLARLGHDVGRGTGSCSLVLTGSRLERDAVTAAAKTLWSHTIPPDTLGDFLREVSLIRETQPEHGENLLLHEVRAVDELLQILEKPVKGRSAPESLMGNMGAAGGMIALGGVKAKEYQDLWRKARARYPGTLSEVRAWWKALEPTIADSGWLANWWLIRIPMVKEQDLLSDAYLACLEAAIRIHIYCSTHDGAWPDSLSQTGEVPMDPFDGQPLRYRGPEEGKPACVYSIGPNLRDDGGETLKPFECLPEDDGDFVVPLEPWSYLEDRR